MNSDKLRVAFNDPEHGWVGLTISRGETTTILIAEYVPSDSFLELTSALHNLLQWECEATARWQYNPTTYDMRFQRSGGYVSLEIFEYPDHRRIEGRGKRIFSARGTYASICTPFWRALRDLQGRFSPEELDARWHRPFPSREIELLTLAIRGRKDDIPSRA